MTATLWARCEVHGWTGPRRGEAAHRAHIRYKARFTKIADCEIESLLLVPADAPSIEWDGYYDGDGSRIVVPSDHWPSMPHGVYVWTGDTP